ncbi:hypothetical protein TNCT_181031 [Trichonephila clavata]|uniref:sn-1-specific diacylglycerol lipase ABHD11 n=1 Tax=Trichonephila clavata TaxID=2740835 RepID=A0A8X6LBN3_TRICU|nr:hypothetical protein TNCT_181031 [Trichonephila clavata]
MASYTPVELAFSSIEPDGCAKDKAPVLFLHGVTSSKEYWYDIPQTVANATKRKVYALDARNHGDSEWSDVFNFDCNVDDLLHFMDRIGAPKVILVGHSMGGITAIKTALRAPERVERLVVEDIAGNKEALSQERMNSIVYFLSLAIKAIQQVPPNEEEEKAKHFILDFLFKNLPEEFKKYNNKDNVLSRIQLKRTADGRYTFRGNIEAVSKALQNAESLMTQPTGLYEGAACFIYGKLSPLNVPSEEQFIKERFPKAKLVGVENATHGFTTTAKRNSLKSSSTFFLNNT